jgi:hypothetical protein
MEPVKSAKTKLFLNINAGPDAKLSSKSFLESHIKYGLWMRPLAAGHLLKAWSKTGSSTAETIAFEAALYQIYGACVEDLITSIVAFYCWKLNSTKQLADVFSQIIVSPTDHRQSDGDFLNLNNTLKAGGKKIRVDPVSFIKWLRNNSEKQTLPLLFGIKWIVNKRNSFFHSKTEKEMWLNLPIDISEVFSLFEDEHIKNFCKGHNKIKHGPQINVISFDQEMYERYINNESNNSAIVPRNQGLLQLLLDGSTLGLSDEQISSGNRAAPIIYPGFQNSQKVFQRIILPRILNWVLALSFLRNQIYPEISAPVSPEDHGVINLLEMIYRND